jgi:hypothetical protein
MGRFGTFELPGVPMDRSNHTPAADLSRTVILIGLLSVKDSRETLNHLDYLVTSVAMEATELDQLADTRHDDTLLRSTCHRYTAATSEVEETFLMEEPAARCSYSRRETAAMSLAKGRHLRVQLLPRQCPSGFRPPPDHEEALSLFGRP